MIAIRKIFDIFFTKQLSIAIDFPGILLVIIHNTQAVFDFIQTTLDFTVDDKSL